MKGAHNWTDVRLSAQTMQLARDCAEAFVVALGASSVSIPAECRPTYIDADPVKVPTDDDDMKYYLVEPIQDGNWRKYNTNRFDGVGFAEESTELACAAQALSCFSFTTFTQGTALLTDVQGVENKLSDPAWTSAVQPKKNTPCFGMGNVGPQTIEKFFELHDHKTNRFCQGLKTTTPEASTWLFCRLRFCVAVKSKQNAAAVIQDIEKYSGYAVTLASTTTLKVCFFY
jgi:hypothetical protein